MPQPFLLRVYDDDSFEYTIIILSDINDGNTIHQKTLIETSIAGEIEGNFITGTGGTAKILEVNNFYNEETSDIGRLMYLTCDAGLESDETTPYFSTKTIDETNFDPPSDVVDNLGIGAWEGLEMVYFGTQYPPESLTSDETIFQWM